MNYGTIDDDFSTFANMADLSFSTGLGKHTGRMMPEGGVTQATGGACAAALGGTMASQGKPPSGVVFVRLLFVHIRS